MASPWGHGMPPLIPPPPGAAMGGHPDTSAFPGFQQQQQQWPPQQVPWGPSGGGAGWNATPGPSTPWGNPAPGPSWANTPGPSPWQQQHQQFQQPQTPGWAPPMMPRPGWGPAPQGMPSPWGENSGPPTPWEWQQQHQPHTPAGLPDGFNATAARPPESSSGQPIERSFFNGGGGGGGGGMPDAYQEEYCDYGDDELEEGEIPNWRHHQGRDPRAAEAHLWENWGQGQDLRPEWAQMQDQRAQWEHRGGAQLVRTHSQGRPPTPGAKKKKKRSHSVSGGQLQQGGWGLPATFDENHLSPRPEDWRDSYSPRGADLSLSSLFRVRKSDPNDWGGDTRKRTLATVLTHNASRPSISYDMRRSPPDSQFLGRFKPRSQQEMFQLAVVPPTARMRLMHPRLPWYIDVVAGQHASGVMLCDLLLQLYNELDRPIAARDFWNDEIGKRGREGLTKAFKERCAMQGEYAREEKKKGVKRVDFLGVDCIFVGLVRRNNVWEIKTDSNH